MNIYLPFATHLYFGVNCFLAGYNHSTDADWKPSRKRFFEAVITALFGLPIVIGICVCGIFYRLWKVLVEQFQANFFLTYYSRGWRKLDHRILYNANKSMQEKAGSKKLKDRIYCYVGRKLNRWNNYTFKEIEPNF